MTVEGRFQERYAASNTPWDIAKPDFNLVQMVTTAPIAPCKALDIGCGTGDNAIWLAQQQFQVLGIDAAEAAIEKARKKALEAKAGCTFMVSDILTSRIEGASFGFAFDRGFLHLLDSDEERRRCAAIVNGHLEENGRWLSLAGNADERRNTPGPPQRSARDIVNAVEPYFEILSLVSGHFGSNQPSPPRAWICLMRKRRSA
jgi:SAM-dependent methyltransferase